MKVILLERVPKLGQMGETVRVKDGFARNFLLKRGKALRATADNRAKFDGMKAELEAFEPEVVDPVIEAVAKARADLDFLVLDAAAFGRAYIANPDLPERIAQSAPLNSVDNATTYGGGAAGYTDYPAL